MLTLFRGCALRTPTSRSIVPAQLLFLSTKASEPADKEKARAKQIEERERIKKQLGKMLLGGTLHDARAAVKKDESKLFVTRIMDEGPILPETLRKFNMLSGKEVRFPHPTKPSALLIAFNQLGWTMLDDWVPALPSKKVSIVKLSVVEGWASGLFESWIASSLKRSTPAEAHDMVSLRTGSFENEKKILGIDNKAVGYVFIINPQGRVAVEGCGQLNDRDRNVINEYLTIVGKSS